MYIRVIAQRDDKNLLVKKNGKERFVVSKIHESNLYQSNIHKNLFFEISPKKIKFDLAHAKDYPADNYQ